MARQETIEIKLIYDAAKSSLETLQRQADTLKNTLGNVNIGGSAQALSQLAHAQTEATNALTANTNAATANTNAATARTNALLGNMNALTAQTNAVTANTNATTANANANTAQTNAVSANTNMMTANMNATAASTNATTANTNANTANTNATTANTTATAARLNAVAAVGNAITSATNATTANTNAVTANTNATAAQLVQQAAAVNLQTQQIQQMTANLRLQNTLTQQTRRLGQAIGQTNAAQSQSIQFMTQWIRQQNGLNTAQVQATGALHNAAGNFQTYRAAVSEAGGATHNYRMAVNTATGEVYQLDQGIRTTSVSLRDMSSILRAVRTVVGFTGIAQSMRSAFTEMKSMSDELVTYRKVTGATAQEMERIRNSAYETSKRYGQTPSDFLSQAATMARAGYGQNATAMAELATKTQLVGDMTADAASKFLIAVDAAYQFGGSVEKLTSILDGANTIDNNYATTIEKISEGMTLTASLASSAHVPVEQLTAALGVMTAVTQRSGTETARGLRQIMLNIIGDTTTEIEEGVTVAEEEMSAMQQALMRYTPEVVKAAQATGKLINPMEAIAALAKQYKEGLLTETELFGITESIGGKRYYNVFTALIQNYDMYEEMLGKVMQSTGSADAEVAAMLDGWTAKANQLSATWTQVVNNTVSENFIKGLIDGGRQALEFAGNLENLAVMAGGAYEAIRSLATGIANLRSGAQFGGFNIATGVFGLAVAGLGAWKAAYEKNIRDMQKEAAEAVSSAISRATDSATLESIQKRYNEIIADGLQEEKGELEELKTLQIQLNGLVGGQETAIDLVNGKYEDTIKLLKTMTEEQRKSAMTDLIAARSKAVAAFNQSDLNGDLLFGEDTGVMLPMLKNKESEWLRHYIQLNTEFFSVGNDSIFRGGLTGTQRLNISKPTDAESIVRLMTEAENLYKLFGTKTSAGGEVTNGLKSMGEEYAGVYTALGAFMERLRAAGNDVVKAQQAIDDFDKEIQSLAETTEEGGKGFTSAAESAYTLEKAIEGATKAKEKFDDAMKTSKADAFNDYVQAFQTLQGEINAGRVNSTAFYASARMLLGDEAYNQTGGTSEGVMAALNRKGSSGTLNRAGELLFGEYYNENGELFEGAGLIELLRNTKGYSSRITQNANGGWNIPGLTEADINEISAAWGGLSKDLIMAFFEALDQSDIKGEATEEAVKAAKTETAGAGTTTEKPELPDGVIEQQNRLAESTQALGEAQEKAAEQTAEALQTVENATSETDALTQEPPETGSNQLAAAQNPDVWQMPPIDLTINTDKAEKAVEELQEETGKVASKQFSDYDNSIEKMQALKAELEATNFQFEDALANLGTTWEEVKAAFLDYQRFTGEPVVTPEMDDTQIRDALDQFMQDWTGREIVFGLNANPNAAIKTADDAVRKINQKSANIMVGATYTGGIIGGLVSGFLKGIRLANGTEDHPGGPAIVNDGNGPELIVNKGRAFIAGGGEPSLVSLDKGAKVFTASETRAIFNRSGVPAYAKGTLLTPHLMTLDGSGSPTIITSGGITTGGGYSTEKPGGSGDKGGNKTTGSSSSGPKIDEKAFENLSAMVDYIVKRIGEALDEQLGIIDKQIDALKQQKDALDAQNELEEKQKAVAEAQRDLETALSERTIRYLGEDGKWHWMADARNVQTAQENLQKAQDALSEYQQNAAYEAEVAALEAQKKALQEEYSNITDAWSKIQAGVETPTGDLAELISAVLTGGTPQQQTGANAIRDYLIGSLMTGGSYAGNYSEALDSIAKATAGSPIMPDGNSASLASLIATGGGLTGSTAEALRVMNGGVTGSVTGAFGDGGTHINYNYFVNGMEIGAEAAQGMTLSEVMRSLTVYAGQ